MECKLRELEWKGAVHALSAFDMDIDKAYWSIQCEVLEPMYEFIFSEWNHIAATDMQNIKKLLKKEKEGPGKEVCGISQTTPLYSELVYCALLLCTV